MCALPIWAEPTQIFWGDKKEDFNSRQDSVNAAMPGLPTGVIAALADLPPGQVCGRCASYDAVSGACRERGFTVVPRDPGCSMFMGIEVDA